MSKNNKNVDNKDIINLESIFYAVIISSVATAILTVFIGIESVTDILQLFFLTLVFTCIIVYYVLKNSEGLTLDKLEDVSILYYLGIILIICLFVIFLYAIGYNLKSYEGMINGIILGLVLVIGYNMVVFLIGLS